MGTITTSDGTEIRQGRFRQSERSSIRPFPWLLVTGAATAGSLLH